MPNRFTFLPVSSIMAKENRKREVKDTDMLQFEELKRELEGQEKALEGLKVALGLEKLREEVEMLEHKASEPGFWDNMAEAQRITQSGGPEGKG